MNFPQYFPFIGRFLFAILLLQASYIHAQWEFAGSPERLNFVSFAWDGNLTYVATWGGIYYSNDQGATWHSIPDNTPFIKIKSFDIKEGKLYVEADSYGRTDQLFVSDDGGFTWKEISLYQNYGTFFDDFVVRGDTMIVAIHPWLHISYDGGQTIAETELTHSTGYFNELFWIGNTLIGTKGTGKSYWRSTDFGKTWIETTYDHVFLFEEIDNKLWRRMLDETKWEHTISYTPDEGITWVDKLKIPSNTIMNAVYVFGDKDNLFVTRNTFSSKEIYYSDDTGETWSVMDADIGYTYTYKYLGGRIFATSNNDIRSSGDGGQTWIQSNTGIKEDRVGSIVLPGDNVLWLSGDVSRDGGLTWSPNPDIPLTVATSGNGYMVGVSGEKIYISEDYGVTWTFNQELFVLGIANVGEIYYLGGKFVLTYQSGQITTSADGGHTWSPVKYLPSDFREIGYNQGKYYAEIHQSRIYISDDAIDWTEVTYDLNAFQLNSQIEGMIFHNNNLILFNWEMYRLDMNGQTWQPSPYLIETDSLYPFNWPVVEQMKVHGDIIIAACNGLGVYVSYDTGLSWVPFNDGLGNLRASCIEFDDKYIYAGMNSGGVWRRPLADLENYNIYKGEVFFDKNQNAVKDTSETLLKGITITWKNSGVFVQSRATGEFTLYTNTTGSDTLEAKPPHIYAHVTTPPIVVNGNTDSLAFGVYLEDVHDVCLDLTNLTVARPGFELCVQLSGKNKGPFSEDLTIVLYPDAQVLFDSADTDPVLITPDSIVWFIQDVEYGEDFRIKASFFVPVELVNGTALKFRSYVTSLEEDIHPQDNNAFLHLLTVGAYDPNDKAVFPEGFVTPAMIADSLNLTYTIRFQNVGTYRADNVRIVDTLSQSLDLSTLEIIAGSHEFSWRIRKDRVLEIMFDNIFLPDSNANEQGSHGFIKYSINALNNIQLGERITNKAYIYFDYNVPVVTNQIESLVDEISLNEDEIMNNPGIDCKLVISPNPAVNNVNITVPDEIELPASLSVFDNAGRLLMTRSLFAHGKNQLDISRYSKGLLWMVISDSSCRYVGKVVKSDP